MAWKRTLMEITVNRNDVGSMPPGSSGVSMSIAETAPVIGSTICTIRPSPKHLRQLVCVTFSPRLLHSSGWSRELLCHAYLAAIPSTRNGMNTYRGVGRS